MQQAYGFNQIALPAGETFNDAGLGQTIAIIDVLDDPYIASDLQTFDETFNIGGAAKDPTNTSFFSVVNEYGVSTLPPTDTFNYGVETSLDVEWAHAMAPGANILLVEANAFISGDLFTAVEYAARQPGVSVISMSFGGGESPTEYYMDNVFTTPAGHQGVSFIASAGDLGGFNTLYPAMSPNVVSVGGTTLPPDAWGNPTRTLEYGWTYGGGGISTSCCDTVEAEPAYQLGVQSTGWRTGPDLAYDSDPNTGVPVYDTLLANALFPGTPWFKIGGTSAAAPQISSLVAITNQLRVAAGDGTLDGPSQLLPAIYQIAASDPNAFQDLSGGVLALSAATGPLQVIGGSVYGGSVTISGSDNVQVNPTITIPPGPLNLYLFSGTLAGGQLSNLSNDGTMYVMGNALRSPT
jgi:subtilase family serine protease